jgi:hypothetical protein
MNPSISPKASLTNTSSILEEISSTLSSIEHSAVELRTKIAPVLVQKNNVCGETSLNEREEASPLNEQLLSILSRLKSHNVFLLNTTQQVTL